MNTPWRWGTENWCQWKPNIFLCRHLCWSTGHHPGCHCFRAVRWLRNALDRVSNKYQSIQPPPATGEVHVLTFQKRQCEVYKEKDFLEHQDKDRQTSCLQLHSEQPNWGHISSDQMTLTKSPNSWWGTVLHPIKACHTWLVGCRNVNQPPVGPYCTGQWQTAGRTILYGPMELVVRAIQNNLASPLHLGKWEINSLRISIYYWVE